VEIRRANQLLRVEYPGVMVRIFRKSRERQLNSRKVPRYLAYAGGEIILIVIGILIALQISNANQERQERAREKEHMVALLIDLENDIASVDHVVDGNRKQLDTLDLLLSQIAAGPVEQEARRRLYINSVKSTYWYLQAEFSEGTISQLKFAGGLLVIRFPDVSAAILRYEQGLRECDNMNEEQRVYFHEVERNQKKLLDLSLAKKAFEFIEQDYLNMLLPLDRFEAYVEEGPYFIDDDPRLLQAYYGDVLFYRTSLNNLNAFYLRQKEMADDLIALIRDRYALR
jgi:hypothetical protein